LLDRDGTLMEDVGYPRDPADVRLIAGAAAAVCDLAAAGFVPAVVSNQSGIARAVVTAGQAAAVHTRFVSVFAEASGLVLPCFYCPHGPDDGCDCRKPRTGLLQQAARELGLPAAGAVMVGDKPADVAAGRAVGATTVWLSHGRAYPAGEPEADFVAASWPEMVGWILRNMHTSMETTLASRECQRPENAAPVADAPGSPER
jgi:histidinol-phosphate phosphatase family protein